MSTMTASNNTASSVFLLQQPVDKSSVSDQDRQFVLQASTGNLAEIAEGKLATSHTDNAAVQLFGRWMITDHAAVGAALQGIAQQLGISLPATLDTQHTQDLQNLKSQYGSGFDQVYAQAQVADHQQTLALFQQEAANGANPTLKSLAQQAIPILQQHLTGAEQLAGGPNSSGSIPSTTPGTQNAPAGTPNAQDINFVQFAAQAGLAEVQEGQLATANPNLAVSEFGRWMVTDHTAVNGVLQSLAQQEGIPVPASPSADQQSEIAHLQSLPQDAFVSAYSGAQITDHANVLLRFIQETAKGQDPAIKAFAQDSIPLLAQHLEGAITLELDQLGIKALGPLSVANLTSLIDNALGTSSGRWPDHGTAAHAGSFAPADAAQPHASSLGLLPS